MRNKLIEDRRAKCREKTLHQNNRQRITIASYGNRTYVNNLEGYYATTTPTMLTSRVVIKQWETNWLKIGEQSAERERSTKAIANGWQLHRTGIEPMSIAWKATMLPLHQRCSHQELWLNNEKQTGWRSESKVQREDAAPKHLLTDDNCIVRESNPCQ